YPYLRVVLEEMEPADGLAALESWRCDLAFIDDLIPLPESDRKAIEKVPLIEDTLYALLPREHRLAERASLSLKELKDERWALDSAWSSFADFVRGLCRQAGYEP